jgi:hypothetical protein
VRRDVRRDVGFESACTHGHCRRVLDQDRSSSTDTAGRTDDDCDDEDSERCVGSLDNRGDGRDDKEDVSDNGDGDSVADSLVASQVAIGDPGSEQRGRVDEVRVEEDTWRGRDQVGYDSGLERDSQCGRCLLSESKCTSTSSSSGERSLGKALQTRRESATIQEGRERDAPSE